MESDKPRSVIFVVAAFVLQAGAVLKLALFLKAHSRSERWLKARRRLQGFWAWCKQETRCLRELDDMRSRWLRRVWFFIFLVSQFRLLVTQWRIWRNGQPATSLDFSALPGALFGLLFTFFPSLINPRTQDLWYIFVSLISSASLRLLYTGDLSETIHILASGRLVFGVLARRTSCVIVVVLANLVLDVMVLRQGLNATGHTGRFSGLDAIVAGALLMLVGILSIRLLLQENALLKVDLHGRTVELGAVSSLLTVCHDAVVEVDESLRLTNDSPQISFMRLNTPGVKNLKGSAFVDLFVEEDKPRIADQLQKALASNSSMAGVFKTYLVDADRNKVRTELFYSLFQSLDQRKSFLIALREMQDHAVEEAVQDEQSELALGGSPLVVASEHALFIMFRMDTFEVVLLSPQMKSCCAERVPVNILDIASDAGRLSMCQQLQTVGNSFANREVQEPQPMSFDLRGLGTVKASVSFEHDALLDGYVGSVVVCPEARRRSRRRSRSSSEVSCSGSIRGLRKTSL